MLQARRRVREQLRQTRGLIRWADAIASPTEFFTLTLWTGKQTIFDFTGSDAHREMMWMFTQWSDEFWSMRWAAGEHESGDWDGLRLGDPANRSYPWQARTPIPDIALGPRRGAGSIDPSHCHVAAITAHVSTSDPRVLVRLVQSYRQLKRHASRPPGLLRCSLGSIERNEYLLLTLWRDYEDSFFLSLPRLLPGAWVKEWQPGDYEIGHWDGLKVRKLAAEPVPKVA